MRSRTFAGFIVVCCLLAVPAAAQGAAKPKLWLLNTLESRRATPGEPARIAVTVDSCAAREDVTVTKTGAPVDHVAGSGALATAGCENGGKLAGTVKQLAFAPAAEGEVTATVGDLVHLQVEPWCVYTLPHKFSASVGILLAWPAQVTATLDKPASFGACAPTHETTVTVSLNDVETEFPYEWEVTG